MKTLPASMICILLTVCCFGMPFQAAADHKVLFEKARYAMETQGDLQQAIKLFTDLIKKYPKERDYAARAQLHIGFCYEKLGLKQAQEAFQKVISQYPEQGDAVNAAKEKLALLSKAQRAPQEGDREFRVRRVYEGSGFYNGTGLSSDGRYAVDTDWYSGNLVVIDIATGKRRPITINEPGAKAPGFGELGVFSPDDRQITYGWQSNSNLAPEIRVVNFDGTNSRTLYRNERFDWFRPCDWTRDGKQVLVLMMQRGKPTQIALLSATDGTIRIIKEIQAADPELDLSPDDRFIACSMPQETNSPKRDVFIIKTDNGEMNSLVAHAADDYLIGWTPDGGRMLFASDRTSVYGIWHLPLSEGRAQGIPELIKTDFNLAIPLRLAPDGVLYYALNLVLRDVCTAAIDPQTGRIQGAPAAIKSRYSGSNWWPEWSPDGSRLAYHTTPGQTAGTSAPAMISIFDIGAGEEKQITPAVVSQPGFSHGPIWAPDGRSLWVIGKRGQESGIYKVDILNSAETPLMIFSSLGFMHAVRSPDGKSLFYMQWKPTRIFRHDLDTSRTVELARISSPAGPPHLSISADGKWLAFASRDETGRMTLYVVSSAGGEPRKAFQVPEDDDAIGSINWTPDGRFLWFTKRKLTNDSRTGSRVTECWRVSPDGSDLRKLDLSFGGYDFRIHPGGRQIAFTKQQSKGELWALENFLSVNKVNK